MDSQIVFSTPPPPFFMCFLTFLVLFNCSYLSLYKVTMRGEMEMQELNLRNVREDLEFKTFQDALTTERRI